MRQDGLSVSTEEPARQEERQHKGREELPQQDQTEAKLITPTPADDVFEEGDGREMWLHICYSRYYSYQARLLWGEQSLISMQEE